VFVKTSEDGAGDAGVEMTFRPLNVNSAAIR